jgi:hypothetical protein
MEEVYYNRGDIIIQQDDIGDAFYILESGTVSITVNTPLTPPPLFLCVSDTLKTLFFSARTTARTCPSPPSC